MSRLAQLKWNEAVSLPRIHTEHSNSFIVYIFHEFVVYRLFYDVNTG